MAQSITKVQVWVVFAFHFRLICSSLCICFVVFARTDRKVKKKHNWSSKMENPIFFSISALVAKICLQGV